MSRFTRELKESAAISAWPSEFFGQIFERSLNEIYVFDAESLKFLQVNQGARNNLGYSMAELVEMTPIDIKPDFDEASFSKLIEPLRQREDALVFETVHARKDGSRYPIEVHLQHMRLHNMAVFTAIILDITDRKFAETELRHANNLLDRRVQQRTQTLRELNTRLEERERDLERIFDAAPDATVLVDSDGIINRVNAQAEKLFGYRNAEMQGERVELLVPERFRAAHVRHRDDFAASPRVREMGVNMDLCGRRKDGSEFPIDVNLSPLEFGGQSLVSAAVRDFTEHRAIQDALQRAKEESDRATTTKSRFLATASHDLRQPLQSLGLYLSVLARQTTDPKALEITGKMRSSLDAMGDLLDALLDISKFESGSIVPEPRDFEVQRLFDQIAADNAPIAAKKGLVLNVQASGLVINSDAVLLQRIVENFVSNAIRYTDSGHVDIACCADGNWAHIDVTDTGIGVPEESIDSIFEEYYQLENAGRDRQHGLGIGLAIVERIAHLLGHELNVESVLGQGSTFSVRVPIAAASFGRSDEDVVAAPERDGGSAIVLLIDDDAAIIDATAMLLESEGFEVITALNGDDALEHCKNGVRPDVVVSDYRLPGLSGIEVIRRLREMGSDHLPAVLMTGDTATRKIADANLPHCTLLHKPVDTERLIDLIHELA